MKKLGLIVACVTAVLIVILASPYVYSWIASSIQTANTPKDVRQAYKNKESSFNDYLAYENNLISSKVVTTKIGKTKTSVCYIHSINGGGWTTAGYSQRCYIRITVGYYTSLTKDEVLTRLLESPLGSSFFDKEWVALYPSDCTLTDFDVPVVIRYVNKGTAPSSLDDYENLDYQKCGQPSSVLQAGGVSDHGGDTKLSIKSIESLTNNPDATRNQVWLEVDYEYFDQPIICKPVLVQVLSSCELSRSQPVQ